LVFSIALLLQSGCTSAPAVRQEIETISVDQAYQLYQDKVAFLDVRTPEEWQEYHIPGATLLPLDQLAANVDKLPRNQDLVIYCRSGNRSVEAARIMLDAGFDNIFSMDGGIKDWDSAGYDVDYGQ